MEVGDSGRKVNREEIGHRQRRVALQCFLDNLKSTIQNPQLELHPRRSCQKALPCPIIRNRPLCNESGRTRWNKLRLGFPRHPPWLKVRFPGGENYHNLKKLVRSHSLHTVCESARCPNIGECWDAGTATFMILGDICTRRCGFCAVRTGRPQGYDLAEPLRVAQAVRTLHLRHAVITSVDRDDLEDEGSQVFARTILDIRRTSPATKVEVLIPDFKRDSANLDRVIEAKPDVLASQSGYRAAAVCQGEAPRLLPLFP